MNEKWERAKNTRRFDVDVTDAPDIELTSVGRYLHRYVPAEIHITWEWTEGDEEAEVRWTVFVYERNANGRPMASRGRLHEYQVKPVPAWLDSIIERSRPRLP